MQLEQEDLFRTMSEDRALMVINFYHTLDINIYEQVHYIGIRAKRTVEAGAAVP